MRLALTALMAGVTPEAIAESRAFYSARAAGQGPTSREQVDALRAAAEATADPRVAREVIQTGRRRVPVRIATPRIGAPRGVYLNLHGGGFYLGSTARDDLRNSDIADRLRLVVVTADHRLAPENPWPAAPDDCEAVALWLIEVAAARFGTARLVIGGTSAGATLAVTTLVRLKDRGAVDAVAGAALQFGTYDLSARTPAGRRIAAEYFLDAYVGAAPDRTLPDVSPVFADLRDLPPTLLVVGSADVLLEDNLQMAMRLSAAGNEVDLRVYPESPHGFTGHPTAVAATARADIESWVLHRLAEG